MSDPTLKNPLDREQRDAIVNLVRNVAKAEILPRFDCLGEDHVSTKNGPEDLVTEADQAAETVLIRELERMFPNALVVGEEAIAHNPALRDQIADAELAFILDPVDGTWNFANGVPLFGVIVSATRFGQPVFGLLYDPMSDDWITATEHGPAERHYPTRPARTLRVSAGAPLRDLAGFVHFSLLPAEKRAGMAKLYPKFKRVNSLRCSCHEYRLLTQGAADFHISGTLNPWDHAAGILTVQRAGGTVRMLDGRDYNAGHTTGYILVAPNEETWRLLRDEFAFLESDTQ